VRCLELVHSWPARSVAGVGFGEPAVFGCTVPEALVVVVVAAAVVLCAEEDEELPPQPAAQRAPRAAMQAMSPMRWRRFIESFP
jgi:hypothetical protein